MPVILDSCSIPRTKGLSSFDRLVATPHLVAVIDGTTGKPWHPVEMTGGVVADQIGTVLAGLTGGESFNDVVLSMTAAVAELKAEVGCSPSQGGAATVAAVLLGPRVVLRVGDPWVRIGDHMHAPSLRAERAVAGARALMSGHALSKGISAARLREDDIAREAVLPLLQAAEELRNHPTSEWAYGAIDGSQVPDQFVEHWRLPDEVVEVTLASDGFPWLGPDLESSEQALAARLARDPLMIEEPPATKGSPSAGASFDDRTFVRMEVPES